MVEKIKNTNLIKIIFDIILSILLVLMFNKTVISMKFHEIGGLILCVFFVIHKLLNRKWIVSVSKKLFSKDLVFKLRFGYIIDFLLLIAMLAILVSGILISKVVFTGISVRGGNWKTIHYFAAALSLVLVGIHIGLHWGLVTGIFKKYIKLQEAIAKPVSIILVSAVILFGAYSMVTSSFSSWLTSPFTTNQMKGRQLPQGFRPDSNTNSPVSNSVINNDANSSTFNNSGYSASNSNTDNSIQKSNTDKAADNIDQDQQNQVQNEASNKDESSRPDSDKSFKKGNRAQDGKMPPDGRGLPGDSEHGGRSGNSNALNVILTFTSIIGAFAAITYYCEKLLRKKKHSFTIIQNRVN